MELLRAREQVRFRLRIAGVGDAAVDRAHRGAGLLVVEADALGAERRVDDEDVLALADRLVRALGLAGPAIDAFLGDDGRHFRSPVRAGFLTRRRLPIHTFFVLVNSRIPSSESSRP